MNYCSSTDGRDAAVCKGNRWTVEQLCPSDYQCINANGQCDPTSEYSVLIICSKMVASTNGHAMCVKPSSISPPPSPPPPTIPAPPPPMYPSCSSPGWLAYEGNCDMSCWGIGYANYCTKNGGATAVGCVWRQWTIPTPCPAAYDCPQDDGTCSPNSVRNRLVICYKSEYMTNVGRAVCVETPSPPPPVVAPSPPPPPPPMGVTISNPVCKPDGAFARRCTVHVRADTITPGADLIAYFGLNNKNATAAGVVTAYNQDLDLSMKYTDSIAVHTSCVVMALYDGIAVWSNEVAIQVT